MMLSLGYDADPGYISSLLDAFGQWDDDKDGMLGFDEFVKLWEHLGGDDRAQAVLESGDPMEAEFNKFAVIDSSDFTKYLDRDSVKAMMIAHGFAPSEQYLEGVFKAMADADLNQDGRLSIDEFVKLYSFLGLG
jgi:Ca2+-binding EF-hand superfamily protein